MEYAKSKKFKNWSRFITLIIILSAIFLGAYYSGFTREYCGTDTSCFSEKAYSCRPAEVYTSRNNNIYYYKINPTIANECKLFIKFDRAQEGTPPEHVTLLEGKSMTCTMPKSEMRKQDVLDMEGIMPYCTGPLKESLYELIVKRMYELIIINLKEISTEADKIMKI